MKNTPFRITGDNAALISFKTSLIKLERSLRDVESSEDLIVGFLKGIGEHYQADRAFIFELDKDMKIGVNTYEWCAPNAESKKGRMQCIQFTKSPRWLNALRDNQPIMIESIESLNADEMEEVSFFHLLEGMPILAAPYSKRLNSGFIGVSVPRVHIDNPDFLMLMSYAIVLELNEIRLEQNLVAAQRRLPPMDPYEVHVKSFGGLEIESYKGKLTELDFVSDQSYCVLANLLLNERHQLPVSKLTQMLWPDNNCESPTRALSNIAYRLRTKLETIGLRDLVQYKNAVFTLNPEYDIRADFYELEALFRRCRGNISKDGVREIYLRATSLYAGILFPRLSSDINMLPTAVFYQNMFISMTVSQVKSCIADKQYIHVHKALLQALHFEPQHPELNMYLIILVYLQGNAVSAKKLLRDSKDLLSDESMQIIIKCCPGLIP